MADQRRVSEVKPKGTVAMVGKGPRFYGFFWPLRRRSESRLGLGLLVGLQRERVASPLAGFRTFPLIHCLRRDRGVARAKLWRLDRRRRFDRAGRINNRRQSGETKKETLDPGLTTEVAMLLMYGVGAYVVVGHTAAAAIAIGGGVAVLLHLKPEMHSLAARIGNADFKAIMQFCIGLVRDFAVLARPGACGPYQVLNAHRIWVLVVLIVGISLAGLHGLQIFRRESRRDDGRHSWRNNFQHRDHGELRATQPARPEAAASSPRR